MMKKTLLLAGSESGIALPLAVIMVVLIGVMGAGLLTFVMADLDSVVAVNKGQRAFEMADAGVAAAKRQLVADCGANLDCANHYNGAGGDVQWSKSVPNTTYSGSSDFGVFLKELDGDAATADRVNVTIESVTTPANSFEVVSTGQYEDAKRRIEAIMTKSDGGAPTIEVRGWRELHE